MEKVVIETEASVGEEMSGNFFPTAVSEEKLQEAREKSLQRIFGSSLAILAVDGKSHKPNQCSYEDIIQDKMTQHYEKGLLCLSQEEWEKAVISFSKAINLCPEKIELYVKRAEAFLQLGDFQSAALNLQKACSDANPSEEHIKLLAGTYYLQGQSLFQQMRHMEALECFTRASELQPQNRHYHMRSICCLAALGRYAECIRLINKQLEEERCNPDLYIVRARVSDHLNKVALTCQDVERALTLDPQHQEAINMKNKLVAKAEDIKDKAVNYAVQGQLQDALKKICYAIENNPSSAQYYIFRGTLYRKLNDFSPAVDDLVRAMQLCNADSGSDLPSLPLHTEAEKQLILTYNDFAVHCYMKGFYQDGVQLLNKALKGEKNKTELYINRGDCLFQLGELAFALADYQQAFELDERDWGVRTRIAKLLNEMGMQAMQMRQYQQAEQHFSEAIRKQPLLSQLYLHRARVRRHLQNNMDSQEDAIISLLLNPKSVEAASTVMYFFPGKTLEEILNSKLSASAGRILERRLEDLPVTWNNSSSPTKLQYGDITPPETKRDIAVCVSDQQLQEMVQSQRRLKTEIQAALTRRGQLQSTAPQIARPPPPPEKPPAHSMYHWKTFGLGMTNPG